VLFPSFWAILRKSPVPMVDLSFSQNNFGLSFSCDKPFSYSRIKNIMSGMSFN